MAANQTVWITHVDAYSNSLFSDKINQNQLDERVYITQVIGLLPFGSIIALGIWMNQPITVDWAQSKMYVFDAKGITTY